MSKDVDYKDIRRAIESERLLLELMVKLTPEQFDALMKASQQYANVAGKTWEVEMLNAKTNAQKQDTERKQKEWEAHLKQKQQENQHLKEMEHTKARLSKEAMEQKMAEERKLADYKLQQETKETEKRVMIQINAKKEVARLAELERQKDVEHIRKQQQLKEDQERKEFERHERLIAVKNREKEASKVKILKMKTQAEVEKGRLLKDITIETERAKEDIRGQYNLKMAELKWNMINNFLIDPAGRERVMRVIQLCAGVFASFYVIRHGSDIAKNWLSNYLFRPTLVSEYKQYRWYNRWGSPGAKKVDVILNPDLKITMDRVSEGTKNTVRHKGFFGHMMLAGPPGTGKTMWAEKLARESKIDFALISGPSFDQFSPNEAIVEIKNLFKWAKSKRKGFIMFIDEADSFLEDRSTLNPDRVRVLNEFITQTGTETKNFMMIFATNRPETIDHAVQTRITRTITFPPPSEAEIQRMLAQYVAKYLDKVDCTVLNEAKLSKISHVLAEAGFAGRDVTNLVISWSQVAFSQLDLQLTESMIDTVVAQQVHKRENERQWEEKKLNKLRAKE